MNQNTPPMTAHKAWAALVGSIAGLIVGKLAGVAFLAELAGPELQALIEYGLMAGGAALFAWYKKNYLTE